MEDQLLNRFQKLITTRYTSKGLKFLGKGTESYNFTDFNNYYKVLYKWKPDWEIIGEQLVNRFGDCKRFANITKFDNLRYCMILIYDYYDTSEYNGGRENELIEFLLECYDRGVACWDLKPSNFRISKTGLFLTDYGWDIKPFNLKDFVFMVQKIYLLSNFYEEENLLNLSRSALRNWDLKELRDFREFFNKIYLKLLDNNLDFKTPKFLPLKTFNKKFLNPFILNFISERKNSKHSIIEFVDGDSSLSLDICTEKIYFNKENHLKLKDLEYNVIICNLVENKSFENYFLELLSYLSQNIRNNSKILFLLRNPFFEESNPPLRTIYKNLNYSGFNVHKIIETPHQILINNEFESEFLIIQATCKQKSNFRVSLIIKTCYQDADLIDHQVKHIVKQCETPRSFFERFVIVDRKEDNFLRQYANPNQQLLFQKLDKLKRMELIDNYFITPKSNNEIEALNERWFNIKTNKTHTERGIPVTNQLYAFERVNGDYILQVDSDVLICRRDHQHDYLSDMISALDKNPTALSVSFNIAHSYTNDIKDYSSPDNGLYVPEVRFCLIHKKRFFEQRPFPNSLKKGKFELSWYRSVELYQKKEGLVSLRGGNPNSFYIHPPNESKMDIVSLLFILDRVEQSYIPELQFEEVDLKGEIDDWAIPKRNEDFIFIMAGRNISPGKFYRCWQSLINQERENWSAIIINDASDNNLDEYIKLEIKDYSNKTTYINNKIRLGILHNIYHSIKKFCINPYSVIIILDLDDMLLNNFVLNKLEELYLVGNEITVGTTLRKQKGIYPFIPNFKNPRNERGGDVWMHLRTFRRYLFDFIKEDHFKKDGDWIDQFTELTYMIPIVELANHHKFISWPLYFWEPTHKRDRNHKLKDKEIISYLNSKKKYSKLLDYEFGVIKPAGEILKVLSPDQNYIFMRHAEKSGEVLPNKNGFYSKNTSLSLNGIENCKKWGKSLPIKIDLIITSDTDRTIETAKHISNSNNSNPPLKIIKELRKVKFYNIEKWEKMKKEHGYFLAIRNWAENEIGEGIIIQFKKFIDKLINQILLLQKAHNAVNILIITHDHILTYLTYHYFKEILLKINYLNGFVLHEL